MLVVDAYRSISLEKAFTRLRQLDMTYGLPDRIRTDNGTLFAANALSRLSQFSLSFIKLGIYLELGSPVYFAGIESSKR